MKMFWKIYSGIKYATLACVEDFKDGADAWQYAFDLACDEYESYDSVDHESIGDLQDMGYDYDEARALYELAREKEIEYFVQPI